MKEKKVKFLLEQGCIIIETTEDTTILRDKLGNIFKVDQFGKVLVLWYPVKKSH